MAVRLIKLFLPDGSADEVAGALEEVEVEGIWIDRLEGGTLEATVLPKTDWNEEVLDTLERHFSSRDGYRLLLLPVAVSLPHPNKGEEDDTSGAESEEEEQQRATRISREELYSEAFSSTELTRVYVVLLLLSSIVAAAGMIRNSPAVIIGAMVIAPLLAPNVALSLATTLGDFALARRAALMGSIGAALVLVFSVITGVLFNNLLVSPEIASRTNVDLADITIALAAGVAGALSFTTGVPAALIGVMVAVALLPPLVAFGMLLGATLWTPALGALMLFLVNIICVNLAGVATFLAQGIKPASWFEAKTARRATLASIALWLALLAVLVAIIVIAEPSTDLRVPTPDLE